MYNQTANDRGRTLLPGIICRTRGVVWCYVVCLDVRVFLFRTIVTQIVREKKTCKKAIFRPLRGGGGELRVWYPNPRTSLSHLLGVLYVRPFFLSPINCGSSDPRSHSRPLSPLPTMVRAVYFIGRRLHLVFASSTRVELSPPTLGAHSS